MVGWASQEGYAWFYAMSDTRADPKLCAGAFFSAIDFFTVANLDDQDDQLLILDRVDDPVIAFANTVERVFASEFLHPLRTWMMLQHLHALDEAFLDRWSEGSKLAFSRRGEKN